MHVDTATELRARAAHVRQLADAMYDRDAQADLRQIANDIDAEAQKLERAAAGNSAKLPIKERVAVTDEIGTVIVPVQ